MYTLCRSSLHTARDHTAMQSPVFQQLTQSYIRDARCVRVCSMELFPAYLSCGEAADIFQELKDVRDYKSGGRSRAAFSDDPEKLSLEGSSTPSTSRVWPPLTLALRDRMQLLAAAPLNFVLINHYDTGRQVIRYHSDSERNSDPIILSVSLGASRTFRVCNKKNMQERDIRLGNGDVLVLRGDFNRSHWHCVPPEPGAGHRINLTFRRVYQHRVHSPPTQPFDTPKHTRSSMPARLPFTLVARCDAAAGDIKLKRWGNVGNYVALTEEAATVERARGGKFSTPDFYLRLRVPLAEVEPQLQAMKAAALVAFPRSAMWLPACVTLSQILNMCVAAWSA